MKFLVIPCLLFSLMQCLAAKDALVSNVTSAQEGELIKIHYDLQGEENVAYRVALSISTESNTTYKYNPQAITGDVGKVVPGPGKEITWTFTKDFPQGLDIDTLDFNITAERYKNNTIYYLLGGGAALLGIVALIATRSEDEGAEPTGSITIDVPGDM